LTSKYACIEPSYFTNFEVDILRSNKLFGHTDMSFCWKITTAFVRYILLLYNNFPRAVKLERFTIRLLFYYIIFVKDRLSFYISICRFVDVFRERDISQINYHYYSLQNKRCFLTTSKLFCFQTKSTMGYFDNDILKKYKKYIKNSKKNYRYIL
jgi:hypothetical protein